MTTNATKRWLTALDISKMEIIPHGYRTILRYIRDHYENGNAAEIFIIGKGYGAKYYIREDLVDVFAASLRKE
jgi:hypothetical protein